MFIFLHVNTQPISPLNYLLASVPPLEDLDAKQGAFAPRNV